MSRAGTVPAPDGTDDIRAEVEELTLLLPAWQVDCLEQAACREGLTASQLARSLIQQYLRQGGWAVPPSRSAQAGRGPGVCGAGPDGGPMQEVREGLERWGAAFERAARTLVAGLARGADADSYAVSVAPCTRHGLACACVTYGMFRSHYEWSRHKPGELARQVVATMLPCADRQRRPAVGE